MATHSSVLAWRIPGTEEPGGLPSMGSHRVEHDWSDLAAAAAHSILKSRDITLLTKFHLVKAMVFPVVMYEYDGAQSLSPVQLFATPWTSLQPIRLLCPWIWELDQKEGWVLMNLCFWTVLLEKTLESPLDSKDIKPVSPKGNQSWIFIGSTDAKAEAPVLWLPDTKNRLIWKNPDAGKDWRQEKGMIEVEMVG